MNECISQLFSFYRGVGGLGFYWGFGIDDIYIYKNHTLKAKGFSSRTPNKSQPRLGMISNMRSRGLLQSALKVMQKAY